ncbi:MAG: pyrroloquinoline quinone biosynthesis protein PqqB [Verrucomicrobia bacterium]|nr:MAG: pyrroloquinoline quinone biosynthesis protein PqqB [Verrucomicrobiota bacterium]
MRIHLLGTAAGGGVPQWNCNCVVCREARKRGGRVQARTQSSVAVSADGQRWFLLNASPDIRAQFQSFPTLWPQGAKARSSPIEGVLLTGAELDATLGLLLLREGERLRVFATPYVQRLITEEMPVARALDSFCGVEWISPAAKPSPLLLHDGSASGLSYECIALPGKPPRFVKRHTQGEGWTVGYRITDNRTGASVIFAPGVARLDTALSGWLDDCDVLLFDGTFWSENEMRERGVGRLSAPEMGHWPIGGPGGSLKVLAGLKPAHKIYTHINNTNPILIEDSPECEAVMAAGCAVGQDGMAIEI